MQTNIRLIQAAAAHPENWTVIKPRRKPNPLLSLRASFPGPFKSRPTARREVRA